MLALVVTVPLRVEHSGCSGQECGWRARNEWLHITRSQTGDKCEDEMKLAAVDAAASVDMS